MTYNTNYMMIPQATLAGKVNEIGKILLDKVGKIGDDDRKPGGLGLLSGLPGKLLFLYQWQKLMPSDDFAGSIDLGQMIDSMMKNHPMMSYCNGMAGAIHCFRILEELYPGSINIKNIEDSYRRILLTSMREDILSGNYDYLHGGIGIANIYAHDEDFAATAMDALEQTGERVEDRIRWKCKLGMEQGTGYNISLSHGISSIVIYLAHVARENSSQAVKQRALGLLREATNFILAQEIDFNKHGSFYPSTSLENGDEKIFRSRMAWCYGDPGVLSALWQAAKTLGDESLRKRVHGMMLRTTQRRDIASTSISDAGICHGSAGLAMIFNYYHDQTGDPVFKEAAAFWTRRTMDFAYFPDGLAGFKSRNYDKEKGYYWQNNFNLLEGISGIGLVLMLAVSGDKNLRKNIYNTFNLY